MAEGEQGDGETGRILGGTPPAHWSLTQKIISACMDVHEALGPGLLESAYEECLALEFDLRGVRFRRQVPLAITYKGIELADAYRLDLLVDEAVIVEIKAVEHVLRVHEAQAITYLKLTGYPVALLVNFNTETLYRGVRRPTLKTNKPSPSPRLPVL